jgi:carboxymethylenebutenolidase
MCDEHSIDDMLDSVRQSEGLSRRRFGTLAMGSLVAWSAARAAGAPAVVEADVDIQTPDGTCDAYFVHPAKGRHAGVIMWPDIGGLRPAFRAMGKRLAEAGYSVLVPNPFYRKGRASRDAKMPNMNDATARGAAMANMQALTAATNVTDAKALVPWLDAQKAVDKRRKLGTMGYCMGGPMTMRTAAALPDRIGAGASFHGAGLASATNPDSPHLLVPTMKASYLIAIAANDDQQDPNQKVLLRAAFDQARLPAEIEVYVGSKHGWCPPDSAVYDEALAEKAWARCLALFKKALA